MVHNIGLEPTVSRVTLLARGRKRRATRPAAQPGRYKDIVLWETQSESSYWDS